MNLYSNNMNLFTELYNASDGVFWKSVFKDFQSNNIPIDLKITESTLSYGDYLIEYKDRDIEHVLSEVQNLLKDTILRARANSYMHDFTSWKNLKKKSTRQAILLEYLIEHGSHLPYKEVLAIYKILLSAITFKLITNEDINMNSKTCKIERIKGVRLNSKNPINIQMNDIPHPDIKSNDGVGYLFK